MGTMKDIDVTGRGLIKGRITVRPEAEGLVVEVDDEGNSEVYLRIAIDREFLRGLMASMDFKALLNPGIFDKAPSKGIKTRVQLILPDIPPQTPPLPDVPPGWPGS